MTLAEPVSNLFVTGFAMDVTEKELIETFQPFGEIESAKVQQNLFPIRQGLSLSKKGMFR